LRFDWAHTLGNYNANNVDGDTFYFQVLQSF